jgi:molybdate transport system substrate-binding protein
VKIPRYAGKVLVAALLAVAFPLAIQCGSLEARFEDSYAQQNTLTISAAASLSDALNEIQGLYAQTHPQTKILFNFGGSGTLELQIERGAPVDIFISAASEQMDALAAKSLLLPDTRAIVASNRVVLIVPANPPPDSPHIGSFADLAQPDVRTIAIGEPTSVPAGHYAQQIFEHAGIWSQVRAKAVLAKDVRQVLAYIETGNADAGVVYATDARITNRVRVVAEAQAGSHDPVIYPAAVVRTSQNADAARDFLKFLLAPPSQAVFEKYGFSPPPN